MSKIKEAIGLLEKVYKLGHHNHYVFDKPRDCIFCLTKEALALLRPLLVEQCKSCKGSGEVWDVREFGAREVGDKIPCPDCQVKDSATKTAEKPPAGEFTKNARYKAENLLVLANVKERNETTEEGRNVGKGWRLLAVLLLKSSDIIDSQALRIKELEQEPEAGELSSMLREYMEHDNLMPATILKNVANCLDRQATEYKDLQADLDAECRVSQNLLAQLKKLKEKQATEIKAKDERFNILANHVVDMSLAIIGWRKKVSFDSEDDLIGELERMVNEALKLVPK